MPPSSSKVEHLTVASHLEKQHELVGALSNLQALAHRALPSRRVLSQASSAGPKLGAKGGAKADRLLVFFLWLDSQHTS